MEQDELFNFLMEEEDLGWKSLLYKLVREEEMNPWDIDISTLTQRYVEAIETMKKFDFRISGKVLFAAALLLRMKSSQFLDEGVDELDRLFAQGEEPEEQDEEFFSEFNEDIFEEARDEDTGERYKIVPKTPNPRKRKVTINDLADALQSAMKSKERKEKRKRRERERRQRSPDVEVPDKKFDINKLLTSVYERIKSFFSSSRKDKMTFNQLLPEGHDRQDKVHTFIPLLHLDNQQKIDIRQESHFGKIEIDMKESEGEVEEAEKTTA